MDLQEGKTVTVTVKLHKGLSVTGTVTDEDGKPAAGVDFYLNMPSGAGGQWSRNDTLVYFTTDELGHFEAAGLPAGKGTINLVPNTGRSTSGNSPRRWPSKCRRRNRFPSR